MGTTAQLTARDWFQIAQKALGLSIAVTIASYLFAYFIFEVFSGGLDRTGMITSALVPFTLSGPLFFYFLLKNVQLRDAYAKLEYIASHDALTGCLTRGAFVSQVENLLADDGTEHPKGALLVVDADNFKSINDRYGHDVGDAALRELTARLTSAVGPNDLVGRLGGEEFGILLRGVDSEEAEAAAMIIRDTVTGHSFALSDEDIALSVSVGGAVFDKPVKYDTLFKCADERLYSVKNSGRNNVELMDYPLAPSQPMPLLRAS